MSNNMLGLINLQIDHPLTELNEDRPLSAQPFAGKFRLIDFTLSGMVNAGIGNIGLLLSFHSRPILDHIRSAKDWNLARKGDGLFYLPGEIEDVIRPVEGDIRAYYKNLMFVERGLRRYLLLSTCDMVHNIDYDQVMHFHRRHNADVTLVYQKQKSAQDVPSHLLTVNERERVTELTPVDQTNPGDNQFLQTVLIDSDIFMKSVRFANAKGYTNFMNDIIGRNLNRLRVFGYEHDGYAARIQSIQSYFSANMDLLDYQNWRNIFKDDTRVYTKIKDEAPAKYMEESQVTNSLVANGCVIEGRVENSILFRKVRVGKNACIRNSIIMQHSVIGDDAQIDYVVCDKNAVIQPEAVLSGSPDQPLCIGKYAVK